MANPIQHAQHARERAHEQIQPYISALLPRLLTNYGGLFAGLIVLNVIGAPLLTRFFPASTATLLVFALALLLLVFGWRWLEARNGATGLFVLYTRYSSQRRALDRLLAQAESGKLDDTDQLYLHVDWLEEATRVFLQRAQTWNLAPRTTTE